MTNERTLLDEAQKLLTSVWAFCVNTQRTEMASAIERWEERYKRLSHEPSEEPKECEHLRSELLAEKHVEGQPLFQMRKCLDCSKTFRVRTSLKSRGEP